MEPRKASYFFDLIRNTHLQITTNDSNVSKVSFLSIVEQQIFVSISEYNLKQTALEKLRSNLTDSGTHISYLEQRLFEVFALQNPCVLMIGYDGRIMSEVELNTAILIDLKKICSELLKELPFLINSTALEPITPSEQVVLEHLRNKDFSSVKIIKRKGKPERIESRQSINTSKRVIDVMRDAEFQDIEIKQEAGKAVYINRVIKTKL